MKKLSLIGVGMIIAVLVLAAAGLAFAQEPTPPTPEFPYGHGSMDKRGFGGGMMGGRGSGGAWSEDAHGPMHEYMLAAWADLFDNMDVEDLEARLDEGETMWDVAQEKGLTQDEFFEQMVAVRTAAIEKMVAAGEIDQEWADWMLERMQGRGGYRGGFSGCSHGGDGFGPDRGSGGRWSPAPQSAPGSDL